jgi:phosphotriesterase-related protein
VARRELDILEAEGLDLGRFIWVHAHTERDTTVHTEAARRGAYVEFDAIGAEKWHPQAALLEATLALLKRLRRAHLLSHDAGWYEVGQPDGRPKPDGARLHALIEHFIPALRARGVSEDVLHLLTVKNPARAFTFTHAAYRRSNSASPWSLFKHHP